MDDAQGERDEYGNLPGFGLRVPTDNPCPEWCTDQRGHGYDAEAVDGFPARWHEAFDEAVEVGQLDDTMRSQEVRLDVHVYEIAEAATGKVVWVEDPELWLVADCTEPLVLTAAQARRMAEVLLRAADRLDEIAAPSATRLRRVHPEPPGAADRQQ